MVHAPTVIRWTAQPGFVGSVRRWTWCRETLPVLLQQLAGAGCGGSVPVIDRPALARAFWGWAASLEAHAELEALEPVDWAHFQVGMLLAQWLRERPFGSAGADRNVELRALTDAALTVLAAWLKAIGAAPFHDATPELSMPRWSSYLENVTEDPGVAVAYLDLFTGREPVWSFPTMPSERPPMRRALAQRRSAVA